MERRNQFKTLTLKINQKPKEKGQIMADGSSLRKPNVDGDDRPGNRNRKNPSDDVDDYSEADESDDCEIRKLN